MYVIRKNAHTVRGKDSKVQQDNCPRWQRDKTITKKCIKNIYTTNLKDYNEQRANGWNVGTNGETYGKTDMTTDLVSSGADHLVVMTNNGLGFEVTFVLITSSHIWLDPFLSAFFPCLCFDDDSQTHDTTKKWWWATHTRKQEGDDLHQQAGRWTVMTCTNTKQGVDDLHQQLDRFRFTGEFRLKVRLYPTCFWTQFSPRKLLIFFRTHSQGILHLFWKYFWKTFQI